MRLMIRFDEHQPTDMSLEELVTVWNEEAKAADDLRQAAEGG